MRYAIFAGLAISALMGASSIVRAADLVDCPSSEATTETKPPAQVFPSGEKVGLLWEFFGSVPRHVIIQNPAFTLEQIGATEGTLSVKCEVIKQFGDGTKILTYNNTFTPATDSKFIYYNGVNGADGRRCDRIVSVYARMEPTGKTVDEAVAALNDPPAYPEFQPFRLSVRGCKKFGPLIED
jgi:hypothetical protein